MNLIGLEKIKVKPIAGRLNDLLSCYRVFYQNTRAFHWNIKGDKFFELHSKYEELYNNLLRKVDEVAERILVLGEIPLHSCTIAERFQKLKALRIFRMPVRE